LAPLLAVVHGPAQDGRTRLADGFSEAETAADTLRVDFHLQGRPAPTRVEAGAGQLRLQYREHIVELRHPRLEATATRDDQRNATLLKLQATVPGIAAAALDAEFDSETYTLRSGRAELNGMEIAELLSAGAPLPDGWTVDGRADLLILTDDGKSFTCDLDAGLARVEFPMDGVTFGSEEIRATARGTWHGGPEAGDATRLAYEHLDRTMPVQQTGSRSETEDLFNDGQ